MSYGKSIRKDVGSHAGIPVPKKDWKIISHHHLALISGENFEITSSFKSGQYSKRMGKKNPLVVMLFCSGCGYAMDYKRANKNTSVNYFWFRKHSILKIPRYCTYYNDIVLQELMLSMTNKELILRAGETLGFLISVTNVCVKEEVM